jgi:integrase/recombinase XerD
MTPDFKEMVQNFSRNCKMPGEFKVKQDVLPAEYEQYLDYYRIQVRRMHSVQCMRQILSGLNLYLQKSDSALCKISIGQVDHFLALYNENYATATCRVNRSYLRKFLKYLYWNGYIKKNLAPLVKSPPEFARSKPPKFLRPKEVEKLFGSLDLSVPKDLRTYATMHLAYYPENRIKRTP